MAEKEAPEELEVEQASTETAAESEAAETDASVDVASDDQVSQLEAELEAAKAEVAEAKDQVLRAKAEAQNMRRRAEQDVEKAHKFALEKFVNELLPVIDSLERAIDACPEGDDNAKVLREGVEMTLSMFTAAMSKFSVDVVDPEGEPFDPQHHQAMSMVENPEVEPNTVIAVMQKGYLLNGRLVRPAMVMVSKAAAGSAKIDEKA